MSKPEYQKYQSLKQGALSDEQNIRLTDSLKDKNIQRIGGTTENPIYGYWDGTKMVTVNTPTGTPTGGTTTIPPGKSLFDVLGRNVGTYEGNRGYDLAGSLGDPLPAGGNWTVKSIGTA